MPRAEFSYPIEGIRGRLGKSAKVYRKMKHGYFESDFVEPLDPQTANQLAVRAAFGAASGSWGQLTPGQRADWKAYGEEYFTDRSGGAPIPLTAFLVFKKVAFYAVIAGAGLPQEAPGLPPPQAIASAEQLESDAADRFAFRITHAIANTAGYRVLLKVSEAAAPGRSPAKRKRHWSAGVGEASLRPLPVSGGVAEWTGARIAVPNDRDYAAELIVLSPEFVPSPSGVWIHRRVVN